MKEITSKDNRLFRHALSLRKKKFRDQYGEYLIEGPNLLKDALREGVKIEALLVRPDFNEEGPDGEILRAPEVKDRTYMISGKLFDELSETETSQGVIAVVDKPDYSGLGIPEGGNIVILDRLQDPGNIGTILRTADAAGYDLAVFVKGTADPFASKVVRSAAGSLFRVPILFCDGPEDTSELVRRLGKKLVVTAMDSDCTCYETDLSGDTAIVIGNEGNGVSSGFLERADLKIRIPMEGSIESLNASVACGILMYERIRRQYERSTTANS